MAHQTKNAFITILKAWLLAGTLDATAAITYYTIKGNRQPGKIFQYIASSVFGKDALTGGNTMVFFGVLFHYMIALAFTLFFFFIYPKINFLAKNKFVIAVLYGGFVWAIMNLLVVPNTLINKYPTRPEGIIVNLIILILMIGLPLSFIIGNYYSRNKNIFLSP
jgi:hypothetical protein